ncbi:MAG: radical SAM protein [Deltaproteobacteria bacterium]|nr:radical SAM protein [Deltaproteobacteria bacterium]
MNRMKKTRVTAPAGKILFVNPWIYDFAAHDFWIKPLGLLYLASILRENGFHIDFIDCLNPYHPGLQFEKGMKKPVRKYGGHGNFPKEHIPKPAPLSHIPRYYKRYGITPRLFHEELQRIDSPDIIFVTSMMTYWYPGVFEAIRMLREHFRNVPIVLGGVYATLCTAHAKKYSGADIVAPGAGECQLAGLIKELLDHELDFIPGMDNLDSIPYPAFDLVSHLDQVPIETSRGCPFRCSYCASLIIQCDFICRHPIKVVDEIEYWHRNFNVADFSFYDDALLVHSKDHLVPMLTEIRERNIRCSFHCPNGLHLKEVNEEISSLMFNTGFKTIRFGFETADATRQIRTGAKISNDETREAIDHLKAAGYKSSDIGVYILCGLPGQHADEVRDSIVFIKSCGARPVITEFSPIPGTRLWNQCVEASPCDIAGEPLFHNNTLMPCRDKSITFEVFHELKRLTREEFF